MKRILFVDPGDFIGGAELFAIDVANYLAKRDDIEMHIAGNGITHYTERLDANVQFHPVKVKRLKMLSIRAIFRFIRAIFAIRRIVKKEQIDVIQSNSIRAHIVCSFVALFTHKPVIWFVHDFTFGAFWASLLASIPQNIIHSSQAVKEDLQQKIKRKHWKKLVQIPNGFDISQVQNIAQQQSINVKKQYHIPHNHSLIGLVGRIDWWKGHKEFISAAHEVLKMKSDVSFLIIGDASQHDPETVTFKKECLLLVKELGIEKNVVFTGHMPEVFAVIADLDILVHASIQPEPFGRVILEGMALSTPVIASNLGGPAEIIHNGIDGILWQSPDSSDLAQRMIDVLNDDALRKKLAQKGLETVQKHYSLNTVAQKLIVLYCLPM